MIKQKCPNSISLYCKAEPDWEIELVQKYTTDPKTGEKVESYKTGGKCKLDPKTCGNSITLSEIEKDVPHYTNTLKETKTVKALEDKSKPKKKSKKDELQARMF